MVVLYMVIFKECKRCRFYSDSRSTACEVFILKIFLYIGRIPWIRRIEAEPQKKLTKILPQLPSTKYKSLENYRVQGYVY